MNWDDIRVANDLDNKQVRKLNSRMRAVNAIGFEKLEVFIGDVKYRVAYSKEEADELNIKYVEWQKVKQHPLVFPFYVLFADNWVAIILGIFKMGRWKAAVTPLGWRLLFYDGLVTKRRKQPPLPIFDIIKNNNVDLFCNDKQSLKTRKQMIALMLAHGCNTEQIKAYFSNDTNYNKTKKIKQYCSKKEVRDMANEFVKKTLEERGITPDFVIDEFYEAVSMAKEKKNLRALVEILKEFANWTGFNDKDTKTMKNTFEMVNYHEDMAKLTSQKEVVKLSQEKEISNNEQ